MDEQLKDKQFLMGSHMTVADAYLFVMLTWAKKTNINFSRCSSLNAFFERMSRRDGVQGLCLFDPVKTKIRS